MIIQRDLQKNIEKWLFKGKILVIYGARQVGKTTLVKNILEKYQSMDGYFNCEFLSVSQVLQAQDPLVLKKFLGDHKIIVLDEAQRVTNIGLNLKLLIDYYPNLQIIATGSSSFDLANQIKEPLTGRALDFQLYPFSISEIKQIYKTYEMDGQLENVLRFGLYPEIVRYHTNEDRATNLLKTLTSQYLYKDVLEFEKVRKPDLVVKLLQLLALQVGQEVSTNELAVNLEVNRDTVHKYIDLLEKAFIIFRLRSFSRNLRKEITKKNKIYFYDLGVRNSLIGRFAPLALREDVGALWENFCVMERLKYLQIANKYNLQYFWRTHSQQEIDYLEEHDGLLEGYEFKWQAKKKYQAPKIFLTAYPKSSVKLISKENYLDLLK